MIYTATDMEDKEIYSQNYYSIGGGFIMSAEELDGNSGGKFQPSSDVPYSFLSAVKMLEMGKENDLTIAQMKRENELKGKDDESFSVRVDKIWNVMNNCIERGLDREVFFLVD